MSKACRAVLVFLSSALPFLVFIPDTAAQSRSVPKVIVLGFDGADAAYTEQWMDEGKLPNLARLRDQGTYRPLLPTTPAQTPVSWSTFSTGINPGRTGIFDFLRRDPETYLPVFAAFDEGTAPFMFGEKNKWIGGLVGALLAFGIAVGVLKLVRLEWAVAGGLAFVLALGAGYGGLVWTEKNIPASIPDVTSRQQGIPMWEVVAKAGLKTRVMRIPVTFPAHDFDQGHMVSGLGVPDISARIGKPFYFTSELDFHRYGKGSNEFSIEVVQLEDNRGTIETTIVGPPNKLFGDPPYIEQPMTLTVSDDRESISLVVGDQTLTMRAGDWSDWVHFEFAFSDVVTIHGISRFHLISVSPEIRLYLSPINFDPSALPPGFRITTPAKWAPQLAEEFGLYKTIGWATDTWAISEGFADEQMFWDDMEWTVEQFHRMFQDFLQSDDDLYIDYFEFTDRVGHIFFRLLDEEHPAYDPDLAAEWGDALFRSYQIMDRIVGEAMAAAEKQNAALIVLSDHGFATWRKSVNYNTWLAEHGYLGLKTGVEAKERDLEVLFDHGQFWENVDWSRTRAYAMGLGNVYINLKGREANGIVEPGEEYDALKAELNERMEAIVDEENGEHPVSRVFTREEIYASGFDPNLIPDLFVTNSRGYRVSWQTSLGGVQKSMYEINDNVWSGDHCSVDPALVKGVFFYNRPIATDREPYIADIYPTVLDLLGVAPPYELDGVALK